MLLFLGKKNHAENQTKAITITQEFFEADFGLIEACVIKKTTCEQFHLSADFNLIVRFSPGKEQHTITLARRLTEETAPLTVTVWTMNSVKQHISEELFQLLNNEETRRHITADIERASVFIPISNSIGHNASSPL